MPEQRGDLIQGAAGIGQIAAEGVPQLVRGNLPAQAKRSGNSGPYFRVLNSDSLLSRIRDNSHYAGFVIMPSTNLREHVCAGRRPAAA